MAKFCTLCSSSSGNCTYIGTAQGGILIDAGESCKQICLGLEYHRIDPRTIKCIFVTHEHSDHVKGIRVFASKYGVDVYATRGTTAQMIDKNIVNDSVNYMYFPAGGVRVGNMLVENFRTSHDSAESCGYTVNIDGETKIAICTDTGIITDEILDAISGSDLCLIESNHDEYMLRHGPYPYVLQQRILSDRGHLSNKICAQTCVKLLQGGTTHFILGHLSEHNNKPQLAYETTMTALTRAGAEPGVDFTLDVAPVHLCERSVIL